jgi:hypothetical protein
LPIRATEWITSSLARHLNIPVPDFAPILNPENDEILFGSKGTWGTASEVEVRTLLTTPQFYDKAVGGEPPWIGAYLSRLYAFDLFVANPDRQLCNFLLVPGEGVRRLLAFDFASANLAEWGGTNFPVAQAATISVGRQLRKLHQFDLKTANEMLDWIAAIPDSVIEGFLSVMPDEWLSEQGKGRISGLWSSGAVGDRLAALRNGIENESLL